MTNTQTSGLPLGVGGKSTSALTAFRAAETNPNRIAGAIGSSSSRTTRASRNDILAENEARGKRNEARADRRATTTDVVEDDEDLLDVPAEEQQELPNPRPVNTDTPMINLFRGYNALTPGSRAGFEALVTNVIAASSSSTQPQPISDPSVIMPAYAFEDGEVKFFTSFDDAFEIPRVIIDLAKSHIHVPLTLLTPSAFEKIHTDPSCIKMRKGMILDDPKKLVLDASGFPAETTLQPADFHEATENFMQLLEHIAGPAIIERFKRHRKFCLSRKPFVDNYEAILAFDIETRRMFFNTKGFLTEAAYERRWNDTITRISQKKADEASAAAIREANKVAALAARLDGSSSNSRYHPYPAGKPKFEGSASSTDGKPFRKGKGASTDGPLCLLCGRTGHKASECTQTHTFKNEPVVCHWKDKILLKANSSIVCISFNIGKCNNTKHGPEFIHACSVCGSTSHHAAARSC